MSEEDDLMRKVKPSEPNRRCFIPERKLWKTVLINGLREAAKCADLQRPLTRVEREDLLWVLRTYQEPELPIGSLDWICREMDLSASKIRQNFRNRRYRWFLIHYGWKGYTGTNRIKRQQVLAWKNYG